MFEVLFNSIRRAIADEGVQGIMVVSSIILAIGTVFYKWIEGWGWIDSFYFAVITIATVGYGDMTPQTVAGKLFTVAYLFCGIGIFVALVNRFANVVLKDANEHRDEVFRKRGPTDRPE